MEAMFQNGTASVKFFLTVNAWAGHGSLRGYVEGELDSDVGVSRKLF